MRSCLFGVVSTVLFAGVYGEIFRHFTLDEGSTFSVTVNTSTDEVVSCHLETPHNYILTFTPGNQSQSTDKYQIGEGRPNLTACEVIIQNIEAKDQGPWKMTYVNTGGARNSQLYIITVNDADREESNENGEITDEETHGIMYLKIQHSTRRGMFIDISLNIESHEEDCYVLPPNGKLMRANLLKMENVTVQNKSNYVSCRITIGPMSEQLLGDWLVCGVTQKRDMRCQPASITWNNNNNPGEVWNTVERARVNHPVHFGASVNPGVEGNGGVVNCHVITPAGEDLVISSEIKYPHIERLATGNTHLCSVIFSDIDQSMLGNWSIYSTFYSILWRMHEERLPLNFFLYNEDNPYEQAYNVTILADASHLVNLGTNLSMVVSGTGKLQHCQVRMPSNETLYLNGASAVEGVFFKSLTTAAACQITLDPITKEMAGEWEIITKFNDGNLFNERHKTFHVIQEDPANPIIDEDRIVENMAERIIVDTEMGQSHRVIISNFLTRTESCHIVTPSGLQYAFIPGFNVSNVDIIDGEECGVLINVLSRDMIGNWTLIARVTGISSNDRIEKRLPFTISIEETLHMEYAINIIEGADLFIRLPNETNYYTTCKLYEPDGEESTLAEVDPFYKYSCGFVKRQVHQNHTGTWKIIYGNPIKYIATVEVNVLESTNTTVENQFFRLGSSVDMIVGPENAVYCKLAHNGNTVYSGFGPCKLVLDRVTIAHQGRWTTYINIPGRILMQIGLFDVIVIPAHTSEEIIETSVDSSLAVTVLTCSVPVEYDIGTCKFRDPKGNIMVATHGVGEDNKYYYLESFVSDVRSHSCTLEIRNPGRDAFGYWRCTVNTDQGIFYGFLKVEHNNYKVDETVLRPNRQSYDRMVGDSLDLTCSIDTAIRYCYFRAENGTVFNVAPGIAGISSPNHQYVGEGLEAGECGMRISSLQRNDTGSWSCHVGFRDVSSNVQEQNASSYVFVDERMWLNRFETEGSQLALEAQIKSEDSSIEYCRFVRNDGLGFDADNAPPGYRATVTLPDYCNLWILNPTGLDRLPWVVAIKIHNIEGEFVVTTDSLVERMGSGGSSALLLLVWMLLITMGVLSFVLGLTSLLSNTNAREWTQNRASQVRTSFRNIIWKKPKHNDTDVTIVSP